MEKAVAAGDSSERSTVVAAAVTAHPPPPAAVAAQGVAQAASCVDATRGIRSGQKPPAHDIFISYAWRPEDKISEDRSLFYGQRRVHTLTRALRRAGYTVWLDTDNMAREATHCAFGAMGLGIKRSSAVVFCVSPEYMLSGSCRTEAHFANEAKKEHRFIVK